MSYLCLLTLILNICCVISPKLRNHSASTLQVSSALPLGERCSCFAVYTSHWLRDCPIVPPAILQPGFSSLKQIPSRLPCLEDFVTRGRGYFSFLLLRMKFLSEYFFFVSLPSKRGLLPLGKHSAHAPLCSGTLNSLHSPRLQQSEF